MATNTTNIFAMIQQRNHAVLTHPKVTIKEFQSDILHASATYPAVLGQHLGTLQTLDIKSLQAIELRALTVIKSIELRAIELKELQALEKIKPPAQSDATDQPDNRLEELQARQTKRRIAQLEELKALQIKEVQGLELQEIQVLERTKRLALLKGKTEQGDSILHSAAPNPESLKIALAAYPKDEWLAALREKNKKGETVFHLAVRNPVSLEFILSLLGNQQQAVLQEKTGDDNTALHLAVPSFESFQMILGLYSQDKQLLAPREKNKTGNTVFHLAASHPKSLQAILNLYPQDKRLAILLEKNNQGENPLELAFSNPAALEIMFQSLSEADCLRAVQEKKLGHNILTRAQNEPAALRVIFEYLPKSAGLALLLEQGPNGTNLLQRMVSNLPNLKVILESFPEAANWIQGEGKRAELSPPFKANPARAIQDMLVLYDHIRQLQQCGTRLSTQKENSHGVVGQQAINLANSLTESLDGFIAATGNSNETREVAAREFGKKLCQGYYEMRTSRELIGPVIFNIALAASLVGLPFVLGKLFATGCGFFMQTERQCKVVAITDAFQSLEKRGDFAEIASPTLAGC